MSIDDEIERAVCSVTPTRSAVPAPDVLAEMRAAMRRERRAWLVRRCTRAVDIAARVLGYAVLALAVATLVLEAVEAVL